MDNSSITTIIPVHDGERFLSRAIDSVLAQTHAARDIIVVDDGSSDRSAAIARSFSSVRCLQTSRRGQAAALNLGVAAAQGELLAFLDADDEWLPGKLAAQLHALSVDTELEAVFGYAEQVVEGPTGVRAQAQLLPARLPSAMLIRRSALARVGPFDTRFQLGMVVEWYARAADAGLREMLLPKPVYRRFIHGANLGLSHAADRHEYARVLQLVLARRRASRLPPEEAGS